MARRCRATASLSRSPSALPTRSARAASAASARRGSFRASSTARATRARSSSRSASSAPALTGPSGLHAIVDVVIEGQKTPHHAVLKDFQRHPIRGTLTHVDFHEVRLDRPIQATVERPARRRVARREAGRRRPAGHARAARRGAADRGARAHRRRHLVARDRRHRPARRPSRDRGRHVPRRSRDGARELLDPARHHRDRGGRRRRPRQRPRPRARRREGAEGEPAAEASDEGAETDAE